MLTLDRPSIGGGPGRTGRKERLSPAKTLLGGKVTLANVFIVDSDQLQRESLMQFLQSPYFTVEGVAGRLSDALARMVTPDCEYVVVWSCDLCDDIQAELARLRASRLMFPAVKFIVLSDTLTRPDDPRACASFVIALQAGVNAILPKGISGETLRHALGLVQLDQRLFPARMVELLAQRAEDP